MLLVIFGAGASYDSVAHLPPSAVNDALHNPERPPLANQLFDNRPIFVKAMREFPEVIPLASPLRRSGVIVEAELAKLKEQSKTYPPARQELAAIRFYLHSALWECQKKWHEKHNNITNFTALLRELKRWRYETNERACLVTFNYDTMVEQAMDLVLGCKFRSFSEYISQDNFALIKLHGSIDWGLEIAEQVSGPQDIIHRVDKLTVTQTYRRVLRPPMVLESGPIGLPALSIPVENKDEFNCPPEHVEELERCIPDVTKIITIGWRATEAEFLKKLKAPFTGLRCAPELMIVSGDQQGAKETCDNLGILTAENRDRYLPI